MARPRAADHDAQRARVLDLACAAFAEVGYPAASMADLAQACGLSKATLYHYFPSKAALLFESLDAYTRQLRAQVDAVRAQGLDPRAELAALIRTLVVSYRDARHRHIALLNDVRHLPEPQREQIRAQQRAVVQGLADTLDRVAPGRFGEGERTPATMALFGMINFTFAWMRPDGPMSYERYAELVIGLCERGFVGEGIDGSSAAHPGIVSAPPPTETHT